MNDRFAPWFSSWKNRLRHTAKLLAMLAPLCGFLINLSANAAEEPSALAALSALEKAQIAAIARAEKSVVAIARVRNDRPRVEGLSPQEIRERFAPQFFREEEIDPSSPDFVPNEYGSGVIIDPNGLIVTNYHVLGDIEKNRYYVWFDRRPYEAEVKAADPWTDLAVLKIKAEKLTPIVFADVKNLKKGQIAISLGNPHAIARDGRPSASWGIISNLRRKAPSIADANERQLSAKTIHEYGTLIETDAKLNFGTSGGALINLRGEMIGLTTALAALDGYEKSAGFAIPVDETFQKTIEKLKQGRKADFGFLGVSPSDLSAQERRQGKLGARINKVVPGTPAASAGLIGENYRNLPHDIITHVNGEQVHGRTSLMLLLGRQPAQAEIRLTIERGNPQSGKKPRILEKNIALSKRYLATKPGAYSQIQDPVWRGMKVDFATAIQSFELSSRLIDPAGCIGILDVQRDSPAWKAGMRQGMFISHVGKARITSPQAFHSAVAKLAGPVQVRLSTQIENSFLRTISP